MDSLMSAAKAAGVSTTDVRTALIRANIESDFEATLNNLLKTRKVVDIKYMPIMDRSTTVYTALVFYVEEKTKGYQLNADFMK